MTLNQGRIQPRGQFIAAFNKQIDDLLKPGLAETAKKGMSAMRHLVDSSIIDIDGIVVDSMGLSDEDATALRQISAERLRALDLQGIVLTKSVSGSVSVYPSREQAQKFFETMERDVISLNAEEQEDFLAFVNSRFNAPNAITMEHVHARTQAELTALREGDMEKVFKPQSFIQMFLISKKLTEIKSKRVLGDDFDEYNDRIGFVSERMRERIMEDMPSEIRRKFFPER